MGNFFKKIKEKALQSLNEEACQFGPDSEFKDIVKVTPSYDYNFEDIELYSLVSDNKTDYFYTIIAGWMRTLIHQLKKLLSQTVSTMLHLTEVLFSQISLLFGLSSSQSSTIFSAYFGTSLSRIPNL